MNLREQAFGRHLADQLRRLYDCHGLGSPDYQSWTAYVAMLLAVATRHDVPVARAWLYGESGNGPILDRMVDLVPQIKPWLDSTKVHFMLDGQCDLCLGSPDDRTLPSECPGVVINDTQAELIRAGHHDFVAGEWKMSIPWRGPEGREKRREMLVAWDGPKAEKYDDHDVDELYTFRYHQKTRPAV